MVTGKLQTKTVAINWDIDQVNGLISFIKLINNKYINSITGLPYSINRFDIDNKIVSSEKIPRSVRHIKLDSCKRCECPRMLT